MSIIAEPFRFKPGDVVHWSRSGYLYRNEVGPGPFVVHEIVDGDFKFTVRDFHGEIHSFFGQRKGYPFEGFSYIWFTLDPFLTAVHRRKEQPCTASK